VFAQLLDVFLHLDKHLAELIRQYGSFTYGILFAIVFLETGVVVTPFLPGDSLLFAAGALAAMGDLNVGLLFLVLAAAAILGDTVNYGIGHKVGAKAFTIDRWFLKHKHLVRTQEFYARHGGKTIFLARFVPIVRTFAPFVAGIGTMSYARFLAWNVVGALAWVATCLFGGYLFGNIPIVKKNFTLVILAIVAVSMVPLAVEYLRHRRGRPS